MGIVDKQLFWSFVSTAAKLIDSYNNQHLANIAWAYSVAVPSINGIELVSIPYWEWDKLWKDKAKKQEYLRELLNM
jgi:hypothetical protein